MLTLWGRSNAYNVQKVRWLLAELGLEYTHISLGGQEGELASSAFLAMNPHGRIPVVQDGEHVIWESNTILRYLAAEYGKDGDWLETPWQRSLVERWMDWELASLQVDFLGLFWGYYRTPVEQRDMHAISHYQARCEQHIRILDAQLGNGGYVAGSKFSLADICIGTSFYRYFHMGLDVDKPANVDGWYRQLCERPAYQKMVMTSFEALKGRLVF